MKRFRILLALAAALAVPSTMLAQQHDSTQVQAGKAAKKSFTLRGVVEGVDAKAGRLTVNHEKVEGWMDAMTMAYAVDKPADLQKVQVGDRIEATVYQDEYKLYDIKVTGKK
ncbi:MAG TPA: copper-binding protein [Bryobacteraceae bacterium]|nr:copper-binding protein [Bryobacteraceae bacterium]